MCWLGSWLLGVPIHDDSLLTCVYILCIRPGLTRILWVTSIREGHGSYSGSPVFLSTLFHLRESGRIRPHSKRPARTTTWPSPIWPILGTLRVLLKFIDIDIIPGWWYTYPSEKYEFVNWDDDIPNWMESHESHVPNHQPDSPDYICISLYIPSVFFANEVVPLRDSDERSSPGRRLICAWSWAPQTHRNWWSLSRWGSRIWNCWAIWMGTGGNDEFNGSSIKLFMDIHGLSMGQTWTNQSYLIPSSRFEQVPGCLRVQF